MDDQSLNRELDAAVNVDPSPEFLARVRTRIAAEPAPSRWRPSWLMVPVAATAVVLLAVLAGERTPYSEPAAPVAASLPAPGAVPPPVDVRGVRLQADRGVRLQPDPPGPRLQPDPDRSLFPEVVVSPDEQSALAFVATITSNGRVEDLDVEPADTHIEAVTLRDVEIVPITGLGQVRIEPLQIARLEGERQ
jgi:hypothetical protein